MTVYNITRPIIVVPNLNLANILAESIASNDMNSPFIQALNSGNLNLVAKNVIALSSVFNIQSLSSATSFKSSQEDNEQKSQLREYLISKVVDLSVSHMSSIKVISSSLASASTNTEQLTRNSAVNLKKSWKIIFIFFKSELN